MTMSMYQASAPLLKRALKNLSAILDKATAHAATKKIDPAVLAGDRLAPDMLPFPRQITIPCDTAKFAMARLAGQTVDGKRVNELVRKALSGS